MNNTKNFPEDFEHEAQKDYVYLLEHKMRMEAEWQQWEEEQQKIKNKLPAKIEVIKVEKHDEVQSNTLPF